MSADNEIYTRVTRVFAIVFDEVPACIGPTTNAADIPEWDSTNHVNVILALEEEFGINFTSTQIEGVENVGQMVDLILSKLQKNNQ